MHLANRHTLLGAAKLFLFFSLACQLFTPARAGTQAQSNDLALQARFWKEAPPAWEEYKRRAKWLQGSIVFKSSQQNAKVETEVEVKKNGRNQLIYSRQVTGAGPAGSYTFYAFVVNPRYAFAVSRNAASSPWVVTNVIDNNEGEGDEEFARIYKKSKTGEALNRLVQVEGELLSEMVRRPGFRVVRCRPVIKDGEKLAEVVFDYPHQSGQQAAQRGTLLLDPKRFWCLRAYDVQRQLSGGLESAHFQVVEMGETDGSLPVPKRGVYASGLSGEKKAEWQTWFEYDLSVPEQLPPDREFTLSAFGLQEPSGVELKGPRLWYLWAAALAACCLGLAILICRRVRSTEQPPRKTLLGRVTAVGAVCFVLLTVHAALAVSGIRQHTVGVDEGGHVLSGLLAWKEGRLDLYPVNPPLVEALVSLPVAASRPDLPDAVRRMVTNDWVPPHTRFMHDNRERYLELMFRARYVLVALSVLGGWLVYRWSRQLFGQVAGLVAVTLWVFSPNVLTWAGVCTVDLGATVIGLAAVYAWRYQLHRPDWLTAAWAGCLLGLAVLSKFTLFLLYPVFLLTWFLAWWQTRGAEGSPRAAVRWLRFALVLLVSVLVLNMGYGFQGTGRQLGTFSFRSQALRGLVGSSWIHGTWAEHLPVPLPETFITGLDQQKDRADRGTPGYLDGEWRRGGWWYWYVYALALKVPLGTLALAGLALWLACRSRRYRARALDEWLLWLPAVAVVALLSTQMRDQYASVRYVLPAFPFLLIGISRVGLLLDDTWRLLTRSLAVQRPLLLSSGAAAVLAALAWNAVSVVRIHPHSMSYFHELAGGPERGWQHLIESNIDWGQDLLFLKRWLDSHPEAKPLGLAYYGGMDPHVVGLDYRLPPSGAAPDFAGPPPGWYAVSVNFVCGASLATYDDRGRFVGIPKDSFAYFRNLTPVAKAGYSIFIYHIVLEQPYRVRTRFGLGPSTRELRTNKNH